MTTVETFLNKLSNYSDKDALYIGGDYIKYADLIREIEIQRKIIDSYCISKGDIVFLVGDYSFATISLFFALSLNKTIVVPITTEVEEELKQRLSVIPPNWIISISKGEFIKYESKNENSQHELIRNITVNNVSGLVLFSSGSTGAPKAMIHDLDNLIGVYINRKEKSLNFLVFLLFDHIGGINTLLNTLSIGATLIIPQSRTPEHVCELIQEARINILPASPTFLNLILISRAYERFDLSSLMMITYGTETMPNSLLEKLKLLFPKVKFLQTFGTSETGIAKTSSLSSGSTFVKIEDPDQEYKIVNGELWLKSKTQILGYINYSNDSFTADGWFKTGDLVEEGENGFIRIIGRTKEVINVGGEKVMPSEVESIILEIPWVKDCIVIGKINAITGQMVTAQVCINDEIDPVLSKNEIRKYCQLKLDSFKVPVKIEIVPSVEFNNRYKKTRNK